ncbi:MAG: alpha-2-macroglobulin family protein [Kofleriaceae bacterium]|nr:alpha-2-macroglobulin family protein [Kofleriaceae bacterium]
MLTVETTVVDVDRQRIRAASRPILVHPSSYYIGLRKRSGTATVLEAVVTDIDGEPVPGVNVDIAIEGVLGSERFRDDAKVIDTQSCKRTSATTPVPCAYTVKDDKTAYMAVATVSDTRGRTNRTQYQIPWWQPEDRKRDFWVTTDQKEYRPGDVAKLEIHSTLVPATAIVTFARQGIITEKRVELSAASTFVDVPIDESYMTNFYAVVDRIATRPAAKAPKPGPLPVHASTQVDIPVDLESARLVMKARATTPVIEPGASATFEVEVRHADKPMANAEVALMVVDEAVLALSKTKHGDPLPGFYARVQPGVDSASTHGLVRDAGGDLVGKPGVDVYKLDVLRGGTGTAYGSGHGGMSGRHAAVPSVRMSNAVALGMRARQDFRPYAVFSPRLRTDAQGKARVSVKMPDSLTRFRIVAVATANTRYFGKAENTIVTQRRLNARTQAPRFLTQGDAFELPVVVQNLDAEPRTIDVAVRAANLEGRGAMGKRVTVPGGQRTEVRFGFATRARGKAMIQTIVSSGAFSDASRIELPVYVPATTESFATYGIVDAAPQYEQLVVPSAILTDVGGVEVEVASTQLQALTDAYWYLYAYPHECAEQRSSRMLATAAIYDVLEAFATPGRPSKPEIEAQRELDVKKLAAQQNSDGGFGYFRGMASDPFVTMQVVSALVASKHAGPVLDQAIRNVDAKVTALLDALDKDVAGTPNQTRRNMLPYDITLAATGLGSLAQAGRDVTTRALKLHAQATKLKLYPVEAKARLLALLAGNARARGARTALRTQLLSAIQETASAATVTTSYVEAERLLLVSNARTTALVLDALIREEPAQPLITKLARGLLDGRTRGRWRSTQENLVVMQAMRRYFDTYEKDTPNFVGKLWLGKKAYAEQPFVGRSTGRAQTHLDWTALGPGSTHDVAIVKDGPGRLYYRVGVTYAPTQIDLSALDAGFVVRRTYTPVDSPADVTKLADGRVRVKLGARVLVEIEILNTTRRHAVAVVDPMPAGFESVNSSLAIAERPVQGSVPEDTFWDFQNLRDERSEAFAMQLGEGRHRFSYTARATTPGTFVAAPAKAEEMYAPETFGRSRSVTVVIE